VKNHNTSLSYQALLFDRHDTAMVSRTNCIS